MADETSTSSVIVDIDTTSASQQLATLNASIRTLNGLQRELKKEIAAGNDEFGRNSQLVAENDKALKLLQAQAKSLTGQIQNETTANEGLGDSFVELDAYCRQLERQYKSLTAAQRESAEGQELKKQLIETKQSLKDFDAELGNHQRNVGNYPDAVRPLLSGLENLANRALPGVTKGMNLTEFSVKGLTKAMLANPIGLVVAALMALWNALQKNDAAMTAVQRLFASFSPILDIFKAGLNAIVGVIGKLADGLSDILSKIGLVKEKQDLVTSMDAIEARERKYTVDSAKRSKQISEARAKAADKETYSTEERMKALEEAMELEKENLKEAQDIARERLRIMVQQARRNQDTSDETANKIAEARAAMYRAEEEYNNGVRKLTRELNAARQEEANAVKAAEKEKADAAKAAAKEREANEKARKEQKKKDDEAELARVKKAAENQSAIEYELAKYTNSLIKDERSRRLADLVLDHKKELEELRKKYEDEASLTEEGRKKLNELMESKEREYLAERQRIVDEAMAESMSKQDEAELSETDRMEMDYENRILALQNFLDTTEDLTIEQRKQLNDQIVALEQEKDTKVEELQKKAAKERAKAIASEVASTADLLGGLYDSLGKLAKAFTDDEKEQAKIEKAMAIGKALVASGVAIAQGTAQAMSVPFPANLAAIATTVATVAANIATAVSTIKSAKFAEGGIVPGTSYTGDLVSARLNSGEMVLNKRQQTQLFELANTGTTSNVVALTEAFTAAVSALPNPVLQYEEFETFQDGVIETRKVATI